MARQRSPPGEGASVSLELDERQRAILKEMRIPVWWPPRHASTEAAREPALDGAASSSAAPASAGPRGMEPRSLEARIAEPRSVEERSAESRSLEAKAPPLQPARTGPSPAVVQSRPAGLTGPADWAALADAVAGCTACAMCTGRRAPVFELPGDQGQADWLVVGDPPDEQEERAGRAFTGQAGQLLDNMLRAVQVTRGGTGAGGARVSNVLKCRPSPVRNPRPDELAQCAPFLQREIALAKPKVILAMGRFAALAVLGESDPGLAGQPFGKLRGSVYHYHGVPVVVTYHPGRLLRAQEDKAGAWADLCLARSAARGLVRTAG